MQGYHRPITHGGRKNSGRAIDGDNNDDVIAGVSAGEGDSGEDLTEEEDKGREDREGDRVLPSSLEGAGRGDESVLINRETRWGDSAGDESIDELYKHLLASSKHHSSWWWDGDSTSLHWACMHIYTQSSFQDPEGDHATTNSMTAANSTPKAMAERRQPLKQALSATESRETVLCIKQQLAKQLKGEILRKETAQGKIPEKEDMYEDFTIKTTVSGSKQKHRRLLHTEIFTL